MGDLVVIKDENGVYTAASEVKAEQYTKQQDATKIISNADLEKVIEKERALGKTIVTLNGGFDVLHEGHDKIVNEAGEQADILLVGLNSDAYIKENKGEDRPVNNFYTRALAMSSYVLVNYVFEFTEDTPDNFLKRICPDVHVTGAEYGLQCPEHKAVAEVGARLHLVGHVDGQSTTNLINNS